MTETTPEPLSDEAGEAVRRIVDQNDRSAIDPRIIEWAAKISTTDCTKVESPLILEWVQQIYALGYRDGASQDD